MSARGKTRRACSPDSPMLATDNNASNSSSENSNHPAASRAGELVILPGGVIGSQSATCSGGGMAASELLELSRRCFSCCNFVLQQEASICGEERRMLLQQPRFAQHQLMKVITNRISEQWYTDMDAFIADFTKLVTSCVTIPQERREVLEALNEHAARMNQSDTRRVAKATFQGFPQPLLEDMMTHAGNSRKKAGLPNVMVDGGIEVGRFFARAYGLGLARGARFCGEENREKQFYAQRKKREAEYRAAVANRATLAAMEAVKKREEKERENERKKKKQKFQLAQSTLHSPTPVQTKKDAHKVDRRTPTAGDIGDDDSGEDVPVESATTEDIVANDISQQFPAVHGLSDVINTDSENESRPIVRRRVNRREANHCHHLQGRDLELDDPQVKGCKHRGTLQGDVIGCLCGCDQKLTGSLWLEHIGGRPLNRQYGRPFKHMRVADTKENVHVHYKKCDTHSQLCDTCRSWEVPAARMTACLACGTVVHAIEACAVRATVDAFVVHEHQQQPARLRRTVKSPTAPTAAGKREPSSATLHDGLQATDARISSPILPWRGPPSRAKEVADIPASPGGGLRSRSSRRRDSSTVMVSTGDFAGNGAGNSGGCKDDNGTSGRVRGEGKDERVLWVCRMCSAGGPGASSRREETSGND